MTEVHGVQCSSGRTLVGWERYFFTSYAISNPIVKTGRSITKNCNQSIFFPIASLHGDFGSNFRWNTVVSWENGVPPSDYGNLKKMSKQSDSVCRLVRWLKSGNWRQELPVQSVTLLESIVNFVVRFPPSTRYSRKKTWWIYGITFSLFATNHWDAKNISYFEGDGISLDRLFL